MRRLALAAAIAALSAATARAEEAPVLCKALHGLADEAQRTGQPQRISDVAGVTDPPLLKGCSFAPDNTASKSFCDATLSAHGLAWRLYDCVNTLAADPQIVTTGDHAEGRTRKVITHLTARLAHGVRLDLRVEPDTGHYDVVVWAPK